MTDPPISDVMKNAALFLFLALLITACSKESLTDLAPSGDKALTIKVQDQMSLLKNYLRDFTSSMDLGELRTLRELSDHKMKAGIFTAYPDMKRIVWQQSRLADQFRRLPDLSEGKHIQALWEGMDEAKSFGDWQPYYGSCSYELQIEKQQLLLQYFACLSGAQNKAEEDHCLLTYLKKNAGLELELYVCTHSVTRRF
jgi:hypothetical protein